MAMNGILIAILEMVIVFKLEGKLPYLRLMMLGTIMMAVSFFLLNIPLAKWFSHCRYGNAYRDFCRNDRHAIYEFLLHITQFGR